MGFLDRLFRSKEISKEYEDSLALAAMDGDISEVSSLLAQGVEINAKNQFGYTALYIAASGGYSNIVKLLLDHKADVNIKNGDHGYTASDIASTKGHAEVVKLLNDHGAEKTGNTGFTENCPSLRGGSPEEIIEYWENSSQRACGNCRHFNYPMVGGPLCQLESTMAIIKQLDHSNIKPKEVKPTDFCHSWFKRE